MTTLSVGSYLLAAVLLITTSIFVRFNAASRLHANFIQLRLIYILPSRTRGLQPERPSTALSHMIIVMGSGGHTAEMVSIVRDIDVTRWKHRTYIVSTGDSFSASKARECEEYLQKKHRPEAEASEAGQMDRLTGFWEVMIVPRAREIHQSKLSAVLSSLKCLWGCLKALQEIKKTSSIDCTQYPDAVITNGPATAVILIMATFVLKFFGFAPFSKMRCMYVESWARVRTLSLSGKILLETGLTDRFYVQWEALRDFCNAGGVKRAEYKGFLVH